MGFLIKFCSSASYPRLVILSNHRLPPSTTIDNHFENKLKRIEKSLETPKELYNLLDDYWNYLKNNFLKNTEKVLETLKVSSCLGCDAASLTVFSSKKGQKRKITKRKYSKSYLLSIIFREIINGKDPEKIPDAYQTDIAYESINEITHFFVITLQPLDWRLPILVIHITKSINGRFTVNEVKDLYTIISIINSHPHFIVKFFAADGEQGLNAFHEEVYLTYRSDILITFKSY